MFEHCPIQSLDDPRLAPYRTMRRQLDHLREEIFVAEGEKVVERLLESSIPVISLLLPNGKLEHFEKRLANRKERITVFTAPKSVLEELTGFHLYQGVLALAKVPPASTLGELVSESQAPRLFMALDGLSNAENLGVLVRNSVAFGVQGLLVSGTSAPPYLRRSVRSSMGTVFKSRYVQTDNLPGALRELRRAGIRVMAAHPHSKQRAIDRANFSIDCCIVFGSEGTGISEAVLAACDETITIPMQQETDSLNVASASAAFLYEAWRQRAGTKAT
jgi:tRNA G18 (ribose-2'-O)-methylase SpoU